MLQTLDELQKRWSQSGVDKGDVLLLHSSLTRILRWMSRIGEKPSLNVILEILLDLLGPNGTLLIPVFNFDFCRGAPFDIMTTPSQMGALTEFARLWPGAIRTGHPVYSFVAIGSKAELFRNIRNHSGYSTDSPFGMLHNLDGKIGIIDLQDQNSMTFYHYVEECLKVPYRYHKTFKASYRGNDGQVLDKLFSIFVRDLEKGVVTHVNPMGELLFEKGLYHGDRPKVDGGLRTISARTLFDETAKVIRSGDAEGMLYDIG